MPTCVKVRKKEKNLLISFDLDLMHIKPNVLLIFLQVEDQKNSFLNIPSKRCSFLVSLEQIQKQVFV